jgi:lantibiotic leader peptide-processing serine protease
MFKTFKPILMLGLTVIAFTNCNKEQVASEVNTTSIPTTQGLVVAPVHYLLEGNRVNSHTAQIRQKIADLGATETAHMPNFKIMAVSSAHPDFKTALEALNVNVEVDFKVARPSVKKRTNTNAVAISSTNSNPYFGVQWNLQAISAPAAWALGYKGQGVRVAVIDDVFFLNHPDLAANFNQTLGRNFVQLPGENPLDVTPYSLTALSHGTIVSGIIAAVDNSIGIIGVAPQAEILPLKVFGPNVETEISWIAQAIVYAADNGAKVINLSLGGLINKSTGGQIAIGLYQQAIQYATAQGATVICGAGNDAVDFDHTGPLDVFPGGSPHALCISATSPDLWYDKQLAGLPNNLDIPTFYTNFGTSRIDFAAPGGSLNFSSTSPNAFYDLVVSTSSGNDYDWAGGTSQSAPHVSGIVALMISKNGGSMPPAQVKTKLRQSADDLGVPGKDAYFGHGRINALNAVQ